jgi:hypothetical protein
MKKACTILVALAAVIAALLAATMTFLITLMIFTPSPWMVEPFYNQKKGRCENVTIVMTPRSDLYRLIYDVNTTASFYKQLPEYSFKWVHISDSTTTRTFLDYSDAIGYLKQPGFRILHRSGTDGVADDGVTWSRLSQMPHVPCYWTTPKSNTMKPSPALVLLIGENDEIMYSEAGVVALLSCAMILVFAIICAIGAGIHLGRTVISYRRTHASYQYETLSPHELESQSDTDHDS